MDPPVATPSGKAVRPFENDDYEYLINCTDLITTCQEALEENNFEHDSELPKPSEGPPGSKCQGCSEETSSVRSPSSAASSGLGLSLEEDLSLKYCQSDEEFSSLNSTSTESYSAKALFAEFIEWLDYVENQLDSVCYCAKLATSVPATPVKPTERSSESDSVTKSNVATARAEPSPIVIPKELDEGTELDDIDEEDEEEEMADEAELDDEIDDADEDEELMMSMKPIPASKSPELLRTRLCLPETVIADWSVILARHKSFQNEFEKIAHRFIKDINQIARQNGLASSSTKLSSSLRQQENRCLQLWLKSLEYLVIIQKDSGQRCPRHYFANHSHHGSRADSNSNSNLLHGATRVASSSVAHRLLVGHPLSRCYSPLFASTPYSALVVRRLQPEARGANLNQSSGSTTPVVVKKVELKSTGIGSSSVVIHNRRVQTRSGGTMIQEEQIVDTHSLSSGSPGADSGVGSSSDKYEIIQKDIGYSSDADMSDAIEAQPHSSDVQSGQKSARKRQVRRRRTRTSRSRPWSYHADWTDWDYYQTPLAICGDHMSNEDMLDYDDEHVIRKLTEFGENYETWISNEHENDDLRAPKHVVVIEKPEVEAVFSERSPVETSDVCIGTSPIPFLEKHFSVIDESEEQKITPEKEAEIKPDEILAEDKFTQTANKKEVACAVMTDVPSGQLVTCSCGGNSNSSYSSIKFYTSMALAGLFAFLYAVTQFSPEIHKSYSRPPPL